MRTAKVAAYGPDDGDGSGRRVRHRLEDDREEKRGDTSRSGDGVERSEDEKARDARPPLR